jgi:ribose/xylose/arabinose/galactoside ABC-type transport system permease subunit
MLTSANTRSRGMARYLKDLGLAGVILLMVIVLTARGQVDRRPGRPNTFLNHANLVEGVATPMSYYAIMATGATIVIITGGIDISLGSVMGLSAMLTAWAMQDMGPDASRTHALAVGIGLPLLIGCFCGALNGLIVVTLRLHPFIVTLGTLSVFRGLTNVLPPQKTMPASGLPLPEAFTTDFMRLSYGGVEYMPLVIMLIIAAFGVLCLTFMVSGVETYAVGGNEEAARFSGIRVSWVKVRAYILSGACAGIAGMVSLGHFGTASATTGLGYELTVVAAAVVGGASLSGGRGSAIGALLGTLIIALIENGIFILRLQQEYRLIIIGSAIVAAVSLDGLSRRLQSSGR